MKLGEPQAYFNLPRVVEEYSEIADRLGLWESEKLAFSRNFKIHDILLELRCRGGRIAFGLQALGYTELTAVD